MRPPRTRNVTAKSGPWAPGTTSPGLPPTSTSTASRTYLVVTVLAAVAALAAALIDVVRADWVRENMRHYGVACCRICCSRLLRWGWREHEG
jgi:hypothetical protein